MQERTLSGLTTGMLVDTDAGWRAIERLEPRDRVHTLGGALRALREVQRVRFGAGLADRFPQGLVLCPGGALDNCEAFYLFPDTHVLMTGAAVEALTGNGAALVRAADLVGHLGIVRALPVDGIDLVTLGFDDEEVVFANSGVRVHCPAPHQREGQVSDLFDVLDADQARVLMACRSFGAPDEARPATPSKSGAAA